MLPPALPLLCAVTLRHGCFNDSWSRTFPRMVSNGGPSDPFGSNATLETCAFLCAQDSPTWTAAAIENGAQCFCTDAAGIAAAAPLERPLSQCSTPCNGNGLTSCGGQWRLSAYDFSCEAYVPGDWMNSSLSPQARVDDLVSRLDVVGLTAQLTQNGADIYATGAQLPRYIVSQECLAGFDGGDIYLAPPIPTTPSSGFPQPVNLGQTFDAELVREVASAISDEARAAWTWLGRPALTCMSPNLNVNRAPQWGRNVESFGEEPALLAALGSAYIFGIQAGLPANASAAARYLKIMAVPKHLGAYSVECHNRSAAASYPWCETYRNTFDAVVDEIDLRETYLPAWEEGVGAARARGVMASYNSINGVPSCMNGDVLRSTLEGDWRFEGFVISDADAVAFSGRVADADSPLVAGHGFTSSLFESAVAALVNGTTISLEDTDPDSNAFASQLPLAVANGTLSLDALRAAARRALLPRFEVGLYDDPAIVPWTSIPASVIEGPEHHALARRAAAASFVLLRNDGLLPFATPTRGGAVKTIAVVGPTSNCSACSVGRYSGHPTTSISAWAGISAAAAAQGVAAVFGGEGLDAQAVAAVAAADAAVVVLTSESEGESRDRFRIGFPADQAAFLSLLLATRTQLVVVVTSGGAVDVEPALAASAVLSIGVGGMEMGNALADILFGAVSPSARLAQTMYRSSWINASDFLDMSIRAPPGRGARYLTPDAIRDHVLFPLYSGLSFSNFTLALVEPPTSISAAALNAGEIINVSVSVINTGAVAADFVVVSQLATAAPAEGWPNAWLPRGGFSKVHSVMSGSEAVATLTLSARDFSRWSVDEHRFEIVSGSYRLSLIDSDSAVILLVE